ncbi:50S ribosomal protein L5 [Candidatus Babeliales bacterium]|nr:50S ribosomal protein L5 [Candidatus Babeliales bacterium]
MSSRLEEMYTKQLRSELQKELGYKNVMQVPRLLKIVINTGVKDAVGDSKVLNQVQEIISNIAGQKAVKTKAKKSIAGFKLREGFAIGVMVTLRSQKMYDFLDKLISLTLPGVRDFRGVGNRFDGSGNYNLGIKDWFVFPELDYDATDKTRGLNITIHTSAQDDKAAHALLKGFKMPFAKLEGK